MHRRANATDSQIENVKRWLHDANYPVKEKERQFINKDGDLIPVVPKTKTPLRRLFDRYDWMKKPGFIRQRKVKQSMIMCDIVLTQSDQ